MFMFIVTGDCTSLLVFFIIPEMKFFYFADAFHLPPPKKKI